MDILKVNSQEQYYFKVKKGLLINKYSAKFNIEDFNNSQISPKNSENYIDTNNTESYLENISNIEYLFTIKLPKKALSNNADKVSEDGLTLTWDLLKHDKSEKIEFEFELYEKNFLIALYIGGALIILIVLVNLFNNPKKEKEIKVIEPIYKKQKEEKKEEDTGLNMDTLESPNVLDLREGQGNSI